MRVGRSWCFLICFNYGLKERPDQTKIQFAAHLDVGVDTIKPRRMKIVLLVDSPADAGTGNGKGGVTPFLSPFPRPSDSLAHCRRDGGLVGARRGAPPGPEVPRPEAAAAGSAVLRGTDGYRGFAKGCLTPK